MRALTEACGARCLRACPYRALYALTGGEFFFKLAYTGIRTQEDTGSDNDTFTIGCSLQW